MEIKTFTYFYPERPRLLSISQPLFETLSDSPDWVAEPKFNGSRLCLWAWASPSIIRWEFWNRHGEPFTFTPAPELMSALNDLGAKGLCLFDGELRHNKTKGVRGQVVLFDCLIFDGRLLLSETFRERRELLASLTYGGPLTLSPQFQGWFRQTFDLLTQQPEIEGLVMKNLKGKLDLGRKRAVESSWMFKVRRPSNSYQF